MPPALHRAQPLHATPPRAPRRKLRLFGMICLVPPLLGLLAAGAGLCWLRTPLAERFLLRAGAELLAGQGLSLTASLSGPLPGRILLTDLAISDAGGCLVKAARAELRWDPTALLLGALTIEAVEIDSPELLRMPTANQNGATDGGNDFVPPLPIRLASLSIRNGLLHKQFLQPGARADSAALGFSLSGAAALSAAALTPGALTAELHADMRPGRDRSGPAPGADQANSGDAAPPPGSQRRGFSLDMRLNGETDSAPFGRVRDRLNLGLDGEEDAGGVLAWLLDRRDLPAMRLSMRGEGGLNDWRGTLVIAAGRENESAPDAPTLSAELRLRCADGALWRNLLLSPEVTARLTAEAGLAGRLPPSLAALTGDRANVEVDCVAAGEELRLKGEARCGIWRLALSETLVRKERISVPRLEILGAGLRAEAAAGFFPGSGAFWARADIVAEKDGMWRDLAARAAGGPVDGAAQAAVAATGDPNALLLLIRADSPALRLPQGSFRNLAVSLVTHLPTRLLREQPAASPRSPSPAVGVQEHDAPAVAAWGDDASALPPDGIWRSLQTPAPAGASPMPPEGNGDPSGAIGQTGAEPAARGLLAVTAEDASGGPLLLSALWRIGLPENWTARAGAGVDAHMRWQGLKGDLSLSGHIPLPRSPDPAALAVSGEARLDVDNWKGLSAVSGLSLSGDPAGMSLKLRGADGMTSASLDLRLPSLRARDPVSGRTLFLLDDLAVSCTLPGLPFSGMGKNVAPDFRLRLGKGAAGDLCWAWGAASLRGRDGLGEFSLSLRRREEDQRVQRERGTRLAASGADSPETLTLRGTLDIRPKASAASPAERVSGRVWLQGSGDFGTAPKGAREGRLHFRIPLRLTAGGLPLPESGAPLEASLRWQGSVVPLWRILALPDRSLSGTGALHLVLNGSLEKPLPSLTASLRQGRYQDIAAGLLLTDMRFDAKSAPGGMLDASLAAGDGRGGALALEAALRGLGDKPTLALQGKATRLRPLHRDDLFLNLSGDVNVSGPLDALRASAEMRVDQGEYLLSPALAASVPTLDLDEEAAAAPDDGGTRGRNASRREDARSRTSPGVALDARILVPRRFFIRGMGLDSEWAGDLRISGTSDAPSLSGALRPVRGQLELLSRTFFLSGGDIRFTGGMGLNPLLNLEMTCKGADLTAVARATGPANRPRLLLESRPPRPADEILAQVLFGKDSMQLSRYEAVQLAGALRELSGAGGTRLDVVSGIRKSVGLDVLRVGARRKKEQRASSGGSGENELVSPQGKASGESEDAPPSLEAGKYLGDGIYVGVEQGSGQESAAVRVEVELFPNMLLQGRSSSQSSEIGIGWKKDY